MTRTSIPRALRQRVIAAARGRCGYCLTQEAITGTPLAFEHIIPQARGGPTAEENLWLSCAQCNLRKNDRLVARDPVTGDQAPLFDPRRQEWAEHFAWAEEGTIIVGLTATGRATVDALDLNRHLLVDARRIWVAGGWHPPVD
jgi:hypothetical protein